MKETELERIAREAREFREAETKRIAAEKDAARREADLRKQLERERIALESGKFRQESAKEREAEENIRDIGRKLSREQELRVNSDVQSKAQQLLEKQHLEQQRVEEERLIAEKRSPPRVVKREKSLDSVSLQTFSGEDDDEEGGNTDDSNLKKQSTLYHDTAMSTSSLENDETEMEGSQGTPVLEKKETAYYDANQANQTSDSFQRAAKASTNNYTKESVAAPSANTFLNARSSQPAGQESKQSKLEFQTSQATTAQTSSNGTVKYDPRSAGESSGFETAQSPAWIQARELFAARGDDNFLGASPHMDPQLEESIISRHNRVQLPKPKKNERGDDDERLEHASIQVAIYEFPIEANASDGTFLVSKDANVSMVTSIVPSRVDGKWSGRLEGNASVGPSSASEQATGSLTVDYKANSWSRISLGMIRGHELFHPLITIGGSLLRHGSILGVNFYHNASFLHSMLLEHSMYSIYFRHLFPNSHWIFSSELSRHQDLSLALSNRKVTSKVTWSLRYPKRIGTRLDLQPKISEYRSLNLFGEWQSFGIWQVGATLIQSLHSQVATIGLGVRLYSARGLEWLLSWNRGSATVRIPIVVSSGIANVHVAQVLYFAMLSFFIQEGVSEIWGWKAADSKDESKENITLTAESHAKARKDAELQQHLMSRQARRKKKEEAEMEGLVIHKATYSAQGGEEWDVTIPLQFWVQRSSLNLPQKSKKHLLGFYDIQGKKETEAVISEKPMLRSGSKVWWESAVRELLDLPLAPSQSELGATIEAPELRVRYDFKGQAYRITAPDDQGLILPNPNAERI